MHIVHHPIFVALSMVIACLGSWTALDLFRRVRAHTSVWRGAWLLAAAVAMGLAIWAMHFIAMLGFNPGADVRYDVALTMLSLGLAIAVTAFAFFFAAEHSPVRVATGGIVMGAGICIMHYAGMAAMMTGINLENEPLFMVLAFLVAVVSSTGALLVALRERTFLQRAAAALVLGFAIVGMHYTAMLGVRMLPGTSEAGYVTGGIDTITLAIAVAAGTAFILLLTLIAALSDRRIEMIAAREAVRSEQQLRAIIEHLPLGIFVAAAPSGEIRFVNVEAERLVGHPLGTKPVWEHAGYYGAVHADGTQLAPQEHALYQAMYEGRRIGPRLQHYRRPDGSLVQLEVVAAPVPDRGGGSPLTVVAIQDVTEKQRAETRIAAAMAEKAEAEAALLRAQRLESLGRLTGGVAHDFNNLLTVVIGALDVILRHPDNAARRKRLGEAALAAARRGARLTAQLLAFARRQPLQPQACDPNRLIRESEPLIRRALHEGVTLVLRLHETHAVASVDPAQFEAALLNLIVNAVDATPRGGEICVETRLCDVSANQFPDLAAGKYFCLVVSDTGHGMSQEVMQRIFEPFFTTKGPGKGTGLGLSQVYGFVRQSGGEVRAHSIAGQGTRFTIYLPVLAEALLEPPQQALPLERSGRELKVLLAEDDPAVAVVVEAMLRNLGHQVSCVENAERALQVLRSDRSVDLLLSDIVMPGGTNGIELARRALELRPGLKVLLSSGHADDSVDKALASGGWPFLKKPYLEDELAARLDSLYAEPKELARFATGR